MVDAVPRAGGTVNGRRTENGPRIGIPSPGSMAGSPDTTTNVERVQRAEYSRRAAAGATRKSNPNAAIQWPMHPKWDVEREQRIICSSGIFPLWSCSRWSSCRVYCAVVDGTHASRPTCGRLSRQQCAMTSLHRQRTRHGSTARSHRWHLCRQPMLHGCRMPSNHSRHHGRHHSRHHSWEQASLALGPAAHGAVHGEGERGRSTARGDQCGRDPRGNAVVAPGGSWRRRRRRRRRHRRWRGWGGRRWRWRCGRVGRRRMRRSRWLWGRGRGQQWRRRCWRLRRFGRERHHSGRKQRCRATARA